MLIVNFCVSGLRSEGSDMSRKVTVKTFKIEYGDQQRTDASFWGRKSIQVSYLKQKIYCFLSILITHFYVNHAVE